MASSNASSSQQDFADSDYDAFRPMETTTTNTVKEPYHHKEQAAKDLNDKLYQRLRCRLLPMSGDCDPHCQFLPESDLGDVLSEEVLEEIIATISTDEKDRFDTKRLMKAAKGKRPKIIATLIFIGRIQLLKYFLGNEIFDCDLPLFSDSKPHVPQGWEARDVDWFKEKQYIVLSPILTLGSLELDKFGSEVRMPYIKPLSWSAKGAHGTVSKVKIHIGHIRWKSPPTSDIDKSCFAVKKFSIQDQPRFEEERQALMRFSEPNTRHKHLLELLFSYQLGTSLFLVFPWAPGNLAEFWSTSGHSRTLDDSFWLIDQCRGVAEGLCKVHKISSGEKQSSTQDEDIRGRHGDIKPENILVFEESGSGRRRLVISDFTLMRFHTRESINNTLVNSVGFSETYCPPEVQVISDMTVNQKCDIWALGCVYLEFITWYLLSYDAIRGHSFKSASGNSLQSFMTLRREESVGGNDKFFTQVNSSTAQVKVCVTRWLGMLRNHSCCTNALRIFLGMIEHRMLIPRPERRSSMDEVLGSLEVIRSNFELPEKYSLSKKRGPDYDVDGFPP